MSVDFLYLASRSIMHMPFIDSLQDSKFAIQEMFFWADVLCVWTGLYDMSLLCRTYLDENYKEGWTLNQRRMGKCGNVGCYSLESQKSFRRYKFLNEEVPSEASNCSK